MAMMYSTFTFLSKSQFNQLCLPNFTYIVGTVYLRVTGRLDVSPYLGGPKVLLQKTKTFHLQRRVSSSRWS